MKNFKTLSWASVMTFCSFFVCALVYAQENPQLTDPEIASVALTANQIDVDYAAIAQKKSKDAAVLRFAKTMKDDHTAVIAQATALAKKLNVTPKTNAVTQSLLTGAATTKKSLNSLSGAAFNKAYIDNEVAFHRSVIHAVETILIPQAQNAELKGLLVKVLPTLKTHLEHAEMIQKDFK